MLERVEMDSQCVYEDTQMMMADSQVTMPPPCGTSRPLHCPGDQATGFLPHGQLGRSGDRGQGGGASGCHGNGGAHAMPVQPEDRSLVSIPDLAKVIFTQVIIV